MELDNDEADTSGRMFVLAAGWIWTARHLYDLYSYAKVGRCRH